MEGKKPVVSMESLRGAGLLREEVPIDRLGGVAVVRELDAGELLKVYQAAMDGPEGDAKLDLQRFEACKIAACLEEPSLGETLDERMLAYRQVEAFPTLIYQALNTTVNKLTNINVQRVSWLAEMIDSIPTLYRMLKVLAEKHGWLSDLDGKTLREFELWTAFHEQAEIEALDLLKRVTQAQQGG